MSSADTKAVVQDFFAAANANDLERMLGLVTDDVAIHTQIPGIAPGLEGFRAFMSVYFSAFPEQRVEVHELIAEGDRVVARHTHHVTQGGEFAGLPPTGKQAVVDGLELFRIEDERIAEMWHHDDLLGLLQQLGAIPAPGGAAV